MKNERELKNILSGELHNATSYFDRLYHASTILSEIGKTHESKELCSKFSQKIYSILDECFKEEWKQTRFPEHRIDEFAQIIKSSSAFFEQTLLLSLRSDTVFKRVQEFINTIYQFSFDFHQIIEKHTHLDVPLPRANFAKNTTTGGKITAFQIKDEDMFDIINSESPRVLSLKKQRENRYNHWIYLGHQEMFDKNYEKAQEYFEKAMNVLETAEVMTLLAWSLSLLNQRSKAKEWCMRAIHLDSTYGAAYNDLGSYLIEDGSLDEALKWFELAKRATNYQNREYPYINCGRIYLQKQNYQRSLEEFSMALTLAPYNDELHELVLKVKKALHKSSFIGNMEEEENSDSPVF